LDTRTSIGILSRNIKIIGEYDINNWGCQILISSLNDSNSNNSGYINFNGV
jgi:hypothetical protein